MRNRYNYVIVDDNPAIHQDLQNILKDCDWLFCVQTFSCLADAICFMKLVQIDFVFLDLELPDMNGLEIFNLSKNVPYVILVTGYMEHFFKNICSNIQNGIVACVEKPVNPAELKNIMTRLRVKTLV